MSGYLGTYKGIDIGDWSVRGDGRLERFHFILLGLMSLQKHCLCYTTQALEGVDTAADHRAIDVFAVFILHTCGHKKTVEALVRSKARAGHFTELLRQDTFTTHTQVTTIM